MPKDARVKNVLIDMGVAVGRELIEVFAVKTSTARPDVYSVIGQLLVSGTADECRRVIVLPRKEAVGESLHILLGKEFKVLSASKIILSSSRT